MTPLHICRKLSSSAANFALAVGVILMLSLAFFGPSNERNHNSQHLRFLQPLEIKEDTVLSQEKSSTHWISMSICWSGNTDLYGKKNFPYWIAAELSTKLWLYKTNASVIIQVVYEGETLPPNLASDLESLENSLNSFAREELKENIGHRFKIVAIPSEGLSCVLRSQLQRMFAYKHIKDSSSIIVTADVDTFPMNPNILSDLESPSYKIWLHQYDMSLKTGNTFNMNFIGMRGSLWEKLLGAEGPEELVEKFKNPVRLKDKSSWDYDQLILSRAILESRLCHISPELKIWNEVELSPRPKLDGENETCFHGDRFLDCNRGRKEIEGLDGCVRWHFFPFEREREVRAKFDEIVGKSEKPSPLQDKAQEVRLELERMLGFRS